MSFGTVAVFRLKIDEENWQMPGTRRHSRHTGKKRYATIMVTARGNFFEFFKIDQDPHEAKNLSGEAEHAEALFSSRRVSDCVQESPEAQILGLGFELFLEQTNLSRPIGLWPV